MLTVMQQLNSAVQLQLSVPMPRLHLSVVTVAALSLTMAPLLTVRCSRQLSGGGEDVKGGGERGDVHTRGGRRGGACDGEQRCIFILPPHLHSMDLALRLAAASV